MKIHPLHSKIKAAVKEDVELFEFLGTPFCREENIEATVSIIRQLLKDHPITMGEALDMLREEQGRTWRNN